MIVSLLLIKNQILTRINPSQLNAMSELNRCRILYLKKPLLILIISKFFSIIMVN
jgi:hypothetical protein